MHVIEGPAAVTLAVVFGKGEEVMAGLRELARERGLAAAHFTALGAFERATIAYFDWDSRRYMEMEVEENVEVAPLVGDIGVDETGSVIVHAHCTLGRRDGSTLAGHLVEATVRPTLELFLTTWAGRLERGLDPESGLKLIAPR
jgi:predicted DNA-binding protein with PD1-like motif